MTATSRRTIETAGPEVARIVMGWDGPMWRYRNPWGPWVQGEPPSDTGRCGYRWEDPFGETNECGKPPGHGGGHLAHWAVDSGSSTEPQR